MTDLETAAQDHARVHVPPPLIYLAGILLGWGLQRIVPLPAPPVGVSRWLGWICVAGWLAGGIGGIATFMRARTSMIPIRPSRALVENGPYRFTRNPMYLGLALLQAAVGFLWRQTWILILLIPVILIVDRFVIRPEERYLERRFGDAYRSYRTRVRRWV
jgi:protein-S-isoprenylcysteine O-methyltransferase Ste14